mmetsp:Transcript_79944/g.222744  ORF Transcript_79944/g.222744 Transcript_79944/m.222744 type:complete len:294 (-) Transcript_79944:232-1113(-)
MKVQASMTRSTTSSRTKPSTSTHPRRSTIKGEPLHVLVLTRPPKKWRATALARFVCGWKRQQPSPVSSSGTPHSRMSLGMAMSARQAIVLRSISSAASTLCCLAMTKRTSVSGSVNPSAALNVFGVASRKSFTRWAKSTTLEAHFSGTPADSTSAMETGWKVFTWGTPFGFASLSTLRRSMTPLKQRSSPCPHARQERAALPARGTRAVFEQVEALALACSVCSKGGPTSLAKLTLAVELEVSFPFCSVRRASMASKYSGWKPPKRCAVLIVDVEIFPTDSSDGTPMANESAK